MKRKTDPAKAKIHEEYQQKMQAWDARQDDSGEKAGEKDGFFSVWLAVVARYRREHYGFKPRKFVFPEEKEAQREAAPFWSRSFLWNPLAGSFALAAFLCGFVFFQNRSHENPVQEKISSGLSPQASADVNFPASGTKLTMEQKEISLGANRVLRMSKGSLVVVNSRADEIPKLDLYGTTVMAEFDLKRKTSLVVRNDFIRVIVTGTAFGINWLGENGKVILRRGSVTVEHNNGQKFHLKAGSELSYTKEGMRLSAASLPTAPAPIQAKERFLFSMKSGEFFKGIILKEDAENVTIMPDEGNSLVLKKTEIDDRIRETALVKKDGSRREK